MQPRIRIISLLPSATEILAYIGYEHFLVGKSHECDYPSHLLKSVPVVTAQRTTFTTSFLVDREVSKALKSSSSTCLVDPEASLYTLDVEKIKSLKPDLILTQDICSVCSVNLAQVQLVVSQISPSPRVLSFNPESLQDVLDQIIMMEEAIGLGDGKSSSHLKNLNDRIVNVLKLPRKLKPRVLFLEWLEPPFVGGHWTPQLIHLAGGIHSMNLPKNYCDTINVDDWRSSSTGAGKSTSRSIQEILAHSFDLILVCPCGLDLATIEKELERMYLHGISKNIPAWWLDVFRKTPTILIDGNQHFNRPGPRLVDALEFLVRLFHNYPMNSNPSFPFKRLNVDSFINEAVGKKEMFKFSAEIEDLHRLACVNGQDTYNDPETGYRVLTSKFLSDRGTCCGNGCRHCPYGHSNVKDPNRRKNDITSTIFMSRESLKTRSRVKILFWSGGKDSWLTWISLKERQKLENEDFDIVLLTTFEMNSQMVPIQNISIRDIIHQSKAMKTSILLVPLLPSSDYKQSVIFALDLLNARTGGTVESLVFGDLRLADIKEWRMSTFSGFKVETPLFGKSYEREILPILWKSCQDWNVSIFISASRVNNVLKEGDPFNPSILSILERQGIDLMGENGEFHTCIVFSGIS